MTREATAAARRRASTALKKAATSANQTPLLLTASAHSDAARVTARTATG